MQPGKTLINLCLFCLLTWTASGQPNFSRANQGLSESTFVPPPDSVRILYLNHGEFIFREIDTLSLNNFQAFNPTLLTEFDHLNLGNVGSPHKNLIYQPRLRKGLDLGLHQYDLYFYPKTENKYFNNSNPYTELYYTAGSQENAVITALFSQNLSKASNIVFDYRKINHRGSFADQRVRHTNLVLNGWFRTNGDKYIGFWSWNNNVIKNQNNGGIQADSLLLDSRYLTRRDLIPVNLNTAQTEYTDNEVSYSQYYQFHKRVKQPPVDSIPVFPVDTLAIPNFQTPPVPFFKADREMPALRLSAARLHHSFSFKDISYKFFDTAPEADASFYQSFQTNQRGIRHFFRIRKLENTFSTRVELGKSTAPEAAPPFQFEPAINYKIHFINQDPVTYTVNNLLVSAKLGIRTKNDGLDLAFYGHYGLADNIGDLAFTGDIGIDFKKFGRVEGRLLQQRYNPSMIQQRFFVSQEEVWNTDFAKTNELNVRAYYLLPKFHLKVGFQYHLIDNLIWYDENAFPSQADDVVNILQIILQKDFHLWKFHFENQLVYQQLNDTFMRLPKFWSKHSIYFESRLFKNVMLTRIGADISYNTNYLADAYFPLTGQFHLQNDVILDFYPRADVFMAFKVKTFRFSIKGENVSQLIFSESYSAAPLYPMRDFTIRFGIGWRFFD